MAEPWVQLVVTWVLVKVEKLNVRDEDIGMEVRRRRRRKTEMVDMVEVGDENLENIQRFVCLYIVNPHTYLTFFNSSSFRLQHSCTFHTNILKYGRSETHEVD